MRYYNIKGLKRKYSIIIENFKHLKKPLWVVNIPIKYFYSNLIYQFLRLILRAIKPVIQKLSF
jgi:hypothetical protein